jgi:RNA polymerase sigma-70 factor (ECF subfamily)
VSSEAESARNEHELALLERARAGDRAAQEALVRRYLDDVYRLTFRLLGSRDRAEDATQDAFVNALQALPRFRGESSFRTWLLRIAANAAKSQGRRWTRHRETALTEAQLEIRDPADPANVLERRAEAARIETALASLPPKQRLAVALRVQQGLSYREIAELAGGTEGAARVNCHLGIKRLRELVQ